MKHLSLLFLCLCIALSGFAKGIKINNKSEIKPYIIKIEKVENVGDQTLVTGKIRQLKRFSYSVDFGDCKIITPSNPDGVVGSLCKWNDDKKIPFQIKPISDLKNESFTIAFPYGSIPEEGDFDLQIGTSQNRDKTKLIIPNLTLQKK